MQVTYASLRGRFGTIRGAAEAIGMPYSTFHKYMTMEKDGNFPPPPIDPAMQNIMDGVGTGLMPVNAWVRTKNADGDKVTVHLKPPRAEQDPNALIDAIKEGLRELPPPPYAKAQEADKDLLAVYPVADLHMGLLTDAEEVGQDWDTKKAQECFQSTFGKLVSVTPRGGTAILAQLGDLTHNDDQRNVTPQSKHQLDVDSRYFMILRRSVAIMKWAIEELRKVYPKVIYRGCRGNHDMNSHYSVTLALAEYYRNTDGVEIIESANEFYVHEFGETMLLLHHGDKAKPERLAAMMANQWREIWGRTAYKLALSGHVHHVTRKEYGGVDFESVGTIIPRDAYAFGHGYTSNRSLVSLMLHRTQGEISRAKVAV